MKEFNYKYAVYVVFVFMICILFFSAGIVGIKSLYVVYDEWSVKKEMATKLMKADLDKQLALKKVELKYIKKTGVK